MNLMEKQNAVCLNGYWDLFFLDGKPAEDAFSSAEWIRDTYLVPSTWNVPDPMYDIFRYPEEWKNHRHGIVRRTQTVCYTPGTRVFLRFDAVGQQAVLYLDRKPIARTKDMFLPFETEITEYLRPGENTVGIALECSSFAAVRGPDGAVRHAVPGGTWFAGCTFGIWQDAWLITRDAAFIRDCTVVTSWREHTVSVSAETDGEAPGAVRGRIFDADGKCVLALDETLRTFWEQPHLWMPDDPYLYTLELYLAAGEREYGQYRLRFGFREITKEGPDLFINGVRLHLRGDAWHYQGLVMQSEEYARNWYRFAMEQGINLIRPHGFPYPQCFYDAADECGMLLMAESAVYGSGKTMQADAPEFIEACREHLTRFVREYRNHPSVICWSMQNEMRWVDGREGYKKAIPELMALMHREDPTGRLVSCDGDNRLLSPETMEAVSMHYNIDGLIADWDGKKPLFFGEHGAYHYVAPQCAADLAGADAYASFWKAVEGVSEKEALFLRYARRKGVSAVTPFNFVNYQNAAMPFTDVVVDTGDITAPGVHPRVLPAGCLPVNNGLLPDYPMYIPQPALDAVRREMRQAAVLPVENDTAFFGGSTVKRSFLIYNDTYRTKEVSVSAVWRGEKGNILLLGTDAYTAEPGSVRRFVSEVPMPTPSDRETVSVTFTVRHNGSIVLEDTFRYSVFAPLPPKSRPLSVVCFGKPGSVPACAARQVSYISAIGELSEVLCGILILGEDLPYTQEQLQEALFSAVSEKRVGAVLVLCQNAFAPGLLTHSKRSFFRLHKTGEHPVLRGLSDDAFSMWAPENPLETMENAPVADAFDKPVGDGWRVLLECAQGDFGWGGMNWCALLEGRTHGVPVLLTQLRLAEFLSLHPAAERLYAGCMEYLTALVLRSAADVSLPSVSQKQDVLVLPFSQAKEREETLRTRLSEGGTVMITGCGGDSSDLLSGLLGREVRCVRAPVYQTLHTSHPLCNGVSDADLTGLNHTTYSSANLVNTVAAEWAFETESAEPLVVSADTPWEAMFTRGKDAEFTKIRCATLFDREKHPTYTYVFSAEPSCADGAAGRLIVSSLASCSLPGLFRAEQVIAQNLGYYAETHLFEAYKQPEQYAVRQLMWLPVSPAWDYRAAVSYHASPDYLLNNLGEGSYGWMQRVTAENGTLRMKGSAGKGVFGTVFISCTLNHDPEHREGGIPDPTIVPDLTLKTNRPVRVYVNGRLFADAETLSASGEVREVKIEDTLLRKGINRLFLEILPGDADAAVEAVFRDKLGNYPDDISYLCTLD